MALLRPYPSACIIKHRHMDKLQLTGLTLGRVFNNRCWHVSTQINTCTSSKQPNLQLKTWPKQVLGSFLLAFALPGIGLQGRDHIHILFYVTYELDQFQCYITHGLKGINTLTCGTVVSSEENEGCEPGCVFTILYFLRNLGTVPISQSVCHW